MSSTWLSEELTVSAAVLCMSGRVAKENYRVCMYQCLCHFYPWQVCCVFVLCSLFKCSGTNCSFKREASRMERCMRNIKVSMIISRGLAQWRSQALIETKNGTDPPTTQHVHSLDAALLHGRPYRSRRHLQCSYCGHRWLHCPTAMVARRNWVPQSGLTSQMWDHQTVTVNQK